MDVNIFQKFWSLVTGLKTFCKDFENWCNISSTIHTQTIHLTEEDFLFFDK